MPDTFGSDTFGSDTFGEPGVNIWSFHHRSIEPARTSITLILASYLDQPPNAIRFEAGPYGKPVLTADTGLHVNWSHSDGRWLLAVTKAGPIGVDVERISPGFAWQGPADIAFHPEERRFIRRQSDGCVERFYRLWVRKEAVFKAAGYGLHDDMARVTVVEPDGTLAIPVVMFDGTRWHVHDVSAPAPTFVAAFAIGFPQAYPPLA